jgi:hypothetical protein
MFSLIDLFADQRLVVRIESALGRKRTAEFGFQPNSQLWLPTMVVVGVIVFVFVHDWSNHIKPEQYIREVATVMDCVVSTAWAYVNDGADSRRRRERYAAQKQATYEAKLAIEH